MSHKCGRSSSRTSRVFRICLSYRTSPAVSRPSRLPEISFPLTERLYKTQSPLRHWFLLTHKHQRRAERLIKILRPLLYFSSSHTSQQGSQTSQRSNPPVHPSFNRTQSVEILFWCDFAVESNPFLLCLIPVGF